ncbi:hypothetical protein RHMOL_Rhmol05G0147300 [Rhododendron molle]|uniref:Uncharacterized protein n=1 Tax=Rhododendron molle TaxID=49168 RepID=A0ACC0NPB4_RHOML|nr:hypothetical protein RHMOL_Rhmol05G0147300 [Rhododendron molle]
MREAEAEERAGAEVQWPRVTAVAEAGAVGRPDYSSETHVPPTPHLFAPSGFVAYVPQRTEYDDEMVLRDLEAHIANTWSEERARQRDIRGFGGAYKSLALYVALPTRVRELVDAVGFEEFIRTLTRSRNDHAVLVALAERWRDTTNTFHLPIGEMTVMPTDIVAITGLRVGGEPIPFDSGIQNDRAALEWFLGEAPKIEEGMARYEQFTKYLKKKLWAYEVLRMYPPQCKHPDLSTLPCALIWSKKNMGSKEGRGDLNAFKLYLDDLRASQINWDLWRVAGAEPEYLARSRAITASRVLLESAFGWQWYLGDRVTRQSLGHIAFQVSGPLPPRASHTSTYTRAELERFTQLDTELSRYLRPEMDYAAYQRDGLAGPLGIRAFRDVWSQARGTVEERRAVRGGAQEWVNEAIRRMLALENVVRRAASGLPLKLRYPAPSPPRAQRAAAKRPQAQGRATSRSKRTRSPPQKKIAARTPTPPVTSRRQTRSSQPANASKEAARQVVLRAEERYRISMRERPSREEGRAQRNPD